MMSNLNTNYLLKAAKKIDVNIANHFFSQMKYIRHFRDIQDTFENQTNLTPSGQTRVNFQDVKLLREKSEEYARQAYEHYDISEFKSNTRRLSIKGMINSASLGVATIASHLLRTTETFNHFFSNSVHQVFFDIGLPVAAGVFAVSLTVYGIAKHKESQLKSLFEELVSNKNKQ